jgi:hypothetical protein
VLLRVRQSGKAAHAAAESCRRFSFFPIPGSGLRWRHILFVNSSGRAKDAEVEYNVLLGED